MPWNCKTATESRTTILVYFRVDPFIRQEIVEYAKARSKLAKMMGRDPETFTDQDVKVSHLLSFAFCTSILSFASFLVLSRMLSSICFQAT